MADEDVFQILIAIGTAVEESTGDFGATPRSSRERVQLAITYLKKKVCPHRDEILRRARSRQTDLAVLLLEILAFWLGNSIPGLSQIAKLIAEMGLEKFCENPESILGPDADAPGSI